MLKIYWKYMLCNYSETVQINIWSRMSLYKIRPKQCCKISLVQAWTETRNSGKNRSVSTDKNIKRIRTLLENNTKVSARNGLGLFVSSFKHFTHNELKSYSDQIRVGHLTESRFQRLLFEVKNVSPWMTQLIHS